MAEPLERRIERELRAEAARLLAGADALAALRRRPRRRPRRRIKLERAHYSVASRSQTAAARDALKLDLGTATGLTAADLADRELAYTTEAPHG